jgi:hypothetical protein
MESRFYRWYGWSGGRFFGAGLDEEFYQPRAILYRCPIYRRTFPLIDGIDIGPDHRQYLGRIWTVSEDGMVQGREVRHARGVDVCAMHQQRADPGWLAH